MRKINSGESIVFLVDLPTATKNKYRSEVLFVGPTNVANEIVDRLQNDQQLMMHLPGGCDTILVHDADGHPPGYVARCRRDAERWKNLANISDDWIVQRAVDRVYDLIISNAKGQTDPTAKTQPTGKKRGRKPLSKREETARINLVLGWTRAKESGTEKKDYCADKGVSFKMLDAFIDWYHKRESRGHLPRSR